MNCPICSSKSEIYGKGVVLNKYEISYFRCSRCGFINTEKPYWLDEAYGRVVSDNQKFRAQQNVPIVISYIKEQLDPKGFYLDYGCARNAYFVEIMRKYCFKFVGYDKYEKVLDQYKGKLSRQFEMITSWEVFEHLPNPKEVVSEMLQYTNVIMIGTQRVQLNNPPKLNWNYFSRPSGRHISFYTMESFGILGKEFGLKVEKKDTKGYNRIVLYKE